MVLRWLIRGVCWLVLAGVVGVGVGSYAGQFGMYKYSAGREWGVGAVQGLGYMDRSGDIGYPTTPLRFYFIRGETADFLPPRTLGFFSGQWLWRADGWLLVFPLWLPALLLVVLNVFVWRRTRRWKLGVGAAGFPVEPAKKAEVPG
jgi:hypothetical protein